jgi:dihydrofolate synthase / folylpolyglutamate synthase
MNYQQAIDFIQSFPDAERGLSRGGESYPPVSADRPLMPLSTMTAFLQDLGNPQNGAATIHITGSKGKGSTATFIAAILKEFSLPTALFTSPHIHSYQERIAFDLRPIAADKFAAGIADLKPTIEKFDKDGFTLSTFGILTALFFRLVAKFKPSWQVVEVGLGGKDDATNVFAHKEAVVITPISLEHTAILGSTRTAIAENKAGIITPGCLVVLAPQPDNDVVQMIRQICAHKQAELVEVDKNDYNPLPYPIKLPGQHQMNNAMTALAVIDGLAKRKRLSVSSQGIKNGLANAFLPGRFEIISADKSRPYTIVLDGAHNGDSAQALAKTLDQAFPKRAVVLIVGVNQDKDLESIWLALKDIVTAVVATRSGNYRSLSPQELMDRIRACDHSFKTIVLSENINEALQKAQELAGQICLKEGSGSDSNEVVICLCGSLYLVAEARAKLMGLYPN